MNVIGSIPALKFMKVTLSQLGALSSIEKLMCTSCINDVSVAGGGQTFAYPRLALRPIPTDLLGLTRLRTADGVVAALANTEFVIIRPPRMRPDISMASPSSYHTTRQERS